MLPIALALAAAAAFALDCAAILCNGVMGLYASVGARGVELFLFKFADAAPEVGGVETGTGRDLGTVTPVAGSALYFRRGVLDCRFGWDGNGDALLESGRAFGELLSMSLPPVEREIILFFALLAADAVNGRARAILFLFPPIEIPFLGGGGSNASATLAVLSMAPRGGG